MFDSADYLLQWPWPPALVGGELDALDGLALTDRGDGDPIEFLLDEAFVGDAAVTRYKAARATKPVLDDPWADDYDPDAAGDPQRRFLDDLRTALPHLRVQAEPRPYWPDRHGSDRRGSDRGRLDQPVLRRRFVQLVHELRRIGHFGAELPEDCVDEHDPPDADALLAERLGIAGLWPLQPQHWGEDTFYGLIEVFHDLSVRPRGRRYHSYNGCGWHYSSFGIETGQALYRWRVNRLLDTAAVGLQLADSGEDVGRLIHVTDPARSDLLQRVATTSDTTVAERIDHAIALFRGRAATEHDKRSAVITLAGVLEERRLLIRTDIGRDDEGALFSMPTTSPSATSAAANRPTTTRRSWTGCSGGTWPPLSSPTGSSPATPRLASPQRRRRHDRRASPARQSAGHRCAGFGRRAAADRRRGRLRRGRPGGEHAARLPVATGASSPPGAPRLQRDPLPAAAATITALPDRAGPGRRQGRHHEPTAVGDPVRPPAPRPARPHRPNARVVAVWEGIRRTHGAPPEQAAPLMPPQLFDVLDACPTTKTWKTRGRRRAAPGRAPGPGPAAGRVRRRPAPQRARRPRPSTRSATTPTAWC